MHANSIHAKCRLPRRTPNSGPRASVPSRTLLSKVFAWLDAQATQAEFAADKCISSPCFRFHETRALKLRFEVEGHLASKASHAGIIRIGFEGISQPHPVEHPCFNTSN